ncbi:MAG TPA: ABC transporter substrate-binding protein [Mycobacteriales bacterium]|nr:ABC transporter substrate-binding protein [Mycobacteriales bacterium]
MDPASFPTVLRESPVFARRFAEGLLPPVAARVGRDPLVIRPVHGVGRYGGTLRRGFIGVADRMNGARLCAGPDSLLYWDFRCENVVPNIAWGYELGDGDRVLTLRLRRGMRWSDGAAFTAEDIVFWREDISLHPDLGASSTALLAGGKPVRVEMVDALTVRYVSAVPNPLLPGLLAGPASIGGLAGNGHAGGGGYAPKHYLARFHPAYTSMAQVDRQAREAGFAGWAAFLLYLNDWSRNPDLPSVTPWLVTRPITDPPWELEANPYSVWVDIAGNQLPYIHTVTMAAVDDLEGIAAGAAAGEYDFQDRHLAVASLPTLMANQGRGGYVVRHALGRDLDFGVRLNLAYDADRYLGELIRNVDFRRALSLAIDRNQINQVFFLGSSIPTATMPADDSRYYPGPDWRLKWARYDPNLANVLLDRIGLTARDQAGYRLRADRTDRIRLDYQAVLAFVDFPAIGEMIREQWRRIGVDLTVQTVSAEAIVARAVGNELMLSGHHVGTDDPFLAPETFLPTVLTSYTGMIGVPYAKWFASGGRDGAEPPPPLALLTHAMSLYRQGLQAGEAARTRLGKQLYKLHADQVWSIGVVGFGLSLYGIYTASTKLGNVPAGMLNTNRQKTPSNALPMTFYYR